MNWLYYLVALFNRILTTERFPLSWSSVNMSMLHKKGDKSDPSNYRGIALVNCTAKIYTMILRDRLEKWVFSRRIIPQCQTGFVADRSCLDNLYTLSSAINFQLRLDKRRVYALFVDFQRAFDSVNHRILWLSLYNLGISAKLIRILKNLYDNANLRVKQGTMLSDSISITEGVLQGESLSPLLFILFISDIEAFFTERGAKGISLDGYHDLCHLLFADDMVFVTDTVKNVQKLSNILYEYVNWKGLKVNLKKTQLVVFKRGRDSTLTTPIFYGYERIDRVSSYTYLGVEFSQTMHWIPATRNAMQKARVASGTVQKILSKARSDSWLSNLKLFHSIISSTVTYGSPVWALRRIEFLEPAQLFYFKRIFQLPISTPGYLLRLELGLVPIAVRIFRLTLSWIIKILDMDDSRLPKICYLRHLALFVNRPSIMDDKTAKKYATYNWIYQVNFFMEKISACYMWDSVDSAEWKGVKEDLVSRLASFYKQEDLRRALKSERIQVNIPRSLEDGPARYLLIRLPWPYIRTVAQAKLSTNHSLTFSFKGIFHQINPTVKCNLCNLNEVESLFHIFFRCPFYSAPRKYWLNCQNAPTMDCTDIGFDFNNICINLLNTNLTDDIAIRNIHNFVKNAMKIRSFHLEY